MSNQHVYSALVIYATLLASFTSASFRTSRNDILREEVYIDVPSEVHGLCFRILNGTHQFGCQSNRIGNEGVLMHAKTSEDVAGAAECWARKFGEYEGELRGFIVAVHERILDANAISLLHNASCVRGVVILAEKNGSGIVPAIEPRSADSACPNQPSSLYTDWRACAETEEAAREAKTNWNGAGAMLEKGAFFLDWQKPVIRLRNHTNIKSILQCFETYNHGDATSGQDGKLCALSMKVFSNAAGSSVTCMRRQQPATFELEGRPHLCDDIQEYSVFALLPPVVVKDKGEEKHDAKYLLLTARLDSFGMIPESSPAAISSLTSVITLLTVAKAVGYNWREFQKAAEDSNHRLLFTFLHGESFDYIGSTRLVYDMENGRFPSWMMHDTAPSKDHPESINLTQLSFALELQQLDYGDTLYIHADGENVGKPGNEAKMRSAASTLNRSLAASSLRRLDSSRLSSTAVLPPSSLHTLLKKDRGIPSMMMTSFGKEYTNRHLNSGADRVDAADAVKVKQTIKAAATAVVALAAEHVQLRKEGAIRVDEAWVDTLYDCFIGQEDWHSCDYFKALFSANSTLTRHEFSSKEGTSTYIGADGASVVRALTAALLVRATGDRNRTKNVNNADQCKQIDNKQNVNSYFWQVDPALNKSFCYRTNVFQMSAHSPAFLTHEVSASDSPYPMWTESFYTVETPRLFLIEKTPFEWQMVAFGLVVAALSALLVGRVNDDSFVVDEGEADAEPL